ncbi:MAG: UDP-glucose 4-epimerase GalE [Bacteroidota bacterium]
MKILVTGGTGYIGSHTVVELINKGYTPVIADNFSNSRKEVLGAIEKITGQKLIFVEADICDKESVRAIFKEHSIAATIHFAAFKAVGESVEQPLKYYRNNLLSLINLLEVYNELKLDNFVFSSSCSVYGQTQELPVCETTPLSKAESPYGNTKQIGEEIMAETVRVSEFNGIALRYFNPAGAHESALIGEYPWQPPSNLVPVITQTAIGKRESTTVFGSDYNTKDGTCVRDYIHVVDIAKAHISAIELLIKKKNPSKFEIYNLGSGNGNTVLEVIRTFERVTGQKLNYKLGSRRPGDVEKVYADTTKAFKGLNWKTELSLEDIVRSAWAWEKHINE